MHDKYFNPEDFTFLEEVIRIHHNIYLANWGNDNRVDVSNKMLKKNALLGKFKEDYKKKWCFTWPKPQETHDFVGPIRELPTNRTLIPENKEHTYYWRYSTRGCDNCVIYVGIESPYWSDVVKYIKELPWVKGNPTYHPERWVPKVRFADNTPHAWWWSPPKEIEYGTKDYYKYYNKKLLDRPAVPGKIPYHTMMSTSKKWAEIIELIVDSDLKEEKANKLAWRMMKHPIEEAWLCSGGLRAAIDDYLLVNDLMNKFNDKKEKAIH
jgi:hypothetical protein